MLQGINLNEVDYIVLKFVNKGLYPKCGLIISIKGKEKILNNKTYTDELEALYELDELKKSLETEDKFIATNLTIINIERAKDVKLTETNRFFPKYYLLIELCNGKIIGTKPIKNPERYKNYLNIFNKSKQEVIK